MRSELSAPSSVAIPWLCSTVEPDAPAEVIVESQTWFVARATGRSILGTDAVSVRQATDEDVTRIGWARVAESEPPPAKTGKRKRKLKSQDATGSAPQRATPNSQELPAASCDLALSPSCDQDIDYIMRRSDEDADLLECDEDAPPGERLLIQRHTLVAELRSIVQWESLYAAAEVRVNELARDNAELRLRLDAAQITINALTAEKK